MATSTIPSSLTKLFIIFLALASLAYSAEEVGLLTCGEVSINMSPCVEYLKSGGAVPPSCCDGFKSICNAATTLIKRRTVCLCLKSDAARIIGIKYDLAEGLPGQCGVSIPYKISPSTDCDSVQ